MSNAEEIWNYVDAKKEGYFDLSDRIWATPELDFNEFQSAAAHIEMLERESFRVTKNLTGIPTAFMGEAGEDGPVIAILGEFDALPGLSQAGGVAEPQPVEDGGHGHGCGHNLLGSGSALAATAVKDFLAANGLKGRVRFYGCPAEEGGGGKAFMARDGAFDDVDVAICWHPGHFNMVWDMSALAQIEADFTFIGRSAHAAAVPHLGRSALDAVELMNVGANYLREHIPSSARVHYAMIDSGGIAPNVVQARATVRYRARAETQSELTDVISRIRKIAEGAALMTETTVTESVQSAFAALLRNRPLEETLHANMARLGATDFDAEDQDLARAFQQTVSDKDIAATYAMLQVKPQKGIILEPAVLPLREAPGVLPGSTDVGNVSRIVPTVQLFAATYAVGTPFHTWQLTGQGTTPAAHKSLAFAAKSMAGTAVDLLRNPALLEAVREEFRQRSAEDPCESLLPADLKPRLNPAAA